MVDTVPMREGNNETRLLDQSGDAAAQPTASCAGNQRDAGLSEGHGHPAAAEGDFSTTRTGWAIEPVIVIDEVLAQQAFGGRERRRASTFGFRIWAADPVSSGGCRGPCAPLGTRQRRSGPSARTVLLSL